MSNQVSFIKKAIVIVILIDILLTGSVVHSMTAHMDAVTGLAIDPHGLYLLSGSKHSSNNL